MKGTATTKQIRKEQLLTLLPLIRKAGNNPNYMGRVMAAKAIFPFMEVSKIVNYCLEGLSSINWKNINSNELHYLLT